ncbi:retrovirus-related pol polyprotein from transposon TNT 1-94 [Tanacetum coccineum]
MEAAVDQCSVDKNAFEIQIKQLRIDNNQLLKQIMSQEIVSIAVNSVDILNVNKSCVNECNECLELETEILKKKDLIEKDMHDKLTRKGHDHKKVEEMIKSLSGKDSVKYVKKDIDEIETINIKLEHSVAKLFFENENLRKEREHLKSIYKDQFDSIRKTRVQSKEHCASLIAQINAKSVKSLDLNAQLQEKVFAIAALKNELRKLKGENVVDTVVLKPSATIALGMFKLDIEPISHRLKNNRDAHEELLVYVSKTCPSLTKPGEKLLVVTPTNMDKKVRFAEPITSSSNIPKQTGSLRTKDSNKPLLTSTGVNTTTSPSRSKPSGSIKKNRISRPPSSNQKNKVEENHRKVKSSLNKTNFVFEPISNAHVKHSMRNAKFESIYAICSKCLFDANHDMCVINYMNNVNVRRTFTIVGNNCPLTRITSTKVVPAKENTNKSVLTPTQGIIVYSRRPKAPKLVGSNSKSNITTSRISNSSDPTQSGGSTISDVPSSSLNDCRFGNDHIANIMGYEDYQMGNVTISQIYYVESKKHSHKPKAEDSIQEKLYLLHMDLCGPMRIQSINGRKYILVIVDDYSRFTWVKFLRSKDEVPEFVIKFLKMIQVLLNATVCNIRTNNGTEFVNQTLRAYYEEVRISHQTSVARTPQQNGIVKRRNRTFVEASRTILIFSKAPKPDLSNLHVFGTLCYPTNDGEDLGKLKPKADIGIFVGYAPAKKLFRIYNKRTRMIIETIHVDFDELTAMASKQLNSGLGPRL